MSTDNPQKILFLFALGLLFLCTNCGTQKPKIKPVVISNQILQPKMETFGWHPYWIKEEANYFPMELISTFVFFAYDINEQDGNYNDADAMQIWRNTPSIDSAKNKHNHVLLCITSYGKQKNEKLLTNPLAWKTLADSLKSLLQLRNAHGIDIDFSNISKERKNDFLSFVKYLRVALGDSAIISLHLQYEELSLEIYALKELKSIVNSFILQGFDYDISEPKPLAPLHSEKQNGKSLQNMLNDCKQQGLETNELILCLPLFGRAWTKEDSTQVGIDISYSDIISIYKTDTSGTIEITSQSTKICIKSVKDSSAKGDTEIWYESSNNMEIKFNWAKDQGCKGFGLWGLGYDGGNPEIWKLFKNQ